MFLENQHRTFYWNNQTENMCVLKEEWITVVPIIKSTHRVAKLLATEKLQWPS